MNREYDATVVTSSASVPASIEFQSSYNPEVLSKLYGSAEGVSFAQPDFTIGDGDDISFDSSTNQYTLSTGSGDCPSDCINRQYWVFSVDNGVVRLIESGSQPGPGNDDDFGDISY